MDIELNTLEKSVLEEIINFNIEKFPFLKVHLPYLQVKSKEYTGVGTYVNFEYLPIGNLITLSKENLILSSDKSLEVDNLEFGLNYELNITNGKFDFLELVTNGEDWDGNFKEFWFE